MPGLVQINVRMTATVVGHDATPHAAIGVQRTADVGIDTPFLPAAQSQTDPAGECPAVGMFADLVDGGRRLASPGEQAGGAAHHFHAVIEDGVFTGLAGRPWATQGHRYAIGTQVVDREASGVEADTPSIVGIGRDTGGIAHGVGVDAS